MSAIKSPRPDLVRVKKAVGGMTFLAHRLQQSVLYCSGFSIWHLFDGDDKPPIIEISFFNEIYFKILSVLCRSLHRVGRSHAHIIVTTANHI